MKISELLFGLFTHLKLYDLRIHIYQWTWSISVSQTVFLGTHFLKGIDR